VLTAVAPFEETTTQSAPRRRRRTFAPGTVLTPAIAAGYWSADLFVHALTRTGKQLSRARLLDALNGEQFTYAVPGTVGRSTWPEMHAQPARRVRLDRRVEIGARY
jgi:hypothetical protein